MVPREDFDQVCRRRKLAEDLVQPRAGPVVAIRLLCVDALPGEDQEIEEAIVVWFHPYHCMWLDEREKLGQNGLLASRMLQQTKVLAMGFTQHMLLVQPVVSQVGIVTLVVISTGQTIKVGSQDISPTLTNASQVRMDPIQDIMKLLPYSLDSIGKMLAVM